MQRRVERYEVVVFNHKGFVVHILQERKAVAAVFVVPQFSVDDRFVVADDALAAFENEIFKILHINFDRLDGFAVKDIVEVVHFHFQLDAFVHFRDAFVLHMAQPLEKHIVALGQDHFHGFFLLAQGNGVDADIFQVEFGRNPFQDRDILRDRLKSMHERIRERFGQVVGHHANISADIEDNPVFVPDEIDEVEKVLFFVVRAQGSDFKQSKYIQIRIEAQ